MRQRTLSHYVYLEHGAYYAIGALGASLLISIHYAVPDLITGLVGTATIALAFLSSRCYNQHARRHRRT